MFGSGILDTVIGLIFVFLLVSLLVTTVNEIIAAALMSRARWLKFGIERMLGSTWAGQLYDHPLIAGSAQGHSARSSGPSYIPSRSFANVLISLVQEPCRGSDQPLRTALARVTADTTVAQLRDAIKELAQPGNGIGAAAAGAVVRQFDRASAAAAGPASTRPYTVADALADAQRIIDAMPASHLRDLLDKIEDAHLKTTLLTLYCDAGDNIEKFKENIEVWFNNGMDRVNGWYKRRSQWITIGVAAVLVVAMNVDAIAIFRHLQTYPAVGQAIVGQATQYAQTAPPGASGDPAELLQQFKAAQTTLTELTLPIGWVADGTASEQKNGQRVPGSWADLPAVGALLAQHAAGWILTALAATLGAPFWFDMLNRVISIRAAGKPPEEDPKPPKAVSVAVEPGQSQQEADRIRKPDTRS